MQESGVFVDHSTVHLLGIENSASYGAHLSSPQTPCWYQLADG